MLAFVLAFLNLQENIAHAAMCTGNINHQSHSKFVPQGSAEAASDESLGRDIHRTNSSNNETARRLKSSWPVLSSQDLHPSISSCIAWRMHDTRVARCHACLRCGQM